MTYNLNGKNIRIPDAEIDKSMKLLGISHDEAVQMWLEKQRQVNRGNPLKENGNPMKKRKISSKSLQIV